MVVERCYRELDRRPCKNPNDRREAGGVALSIMFNDLHPKIDGERVRGDIHSSSAGYAGICIDEKMPQDHACRNVNSRRLRSRASRAVHRGLTSLYSL